MISMQGVPSSLIAKNESWVRKQAQALARHLPSNVEKADLIQVGLIAVAQAALGFEWEGDRDTPEATEAFLRYARARVKGAMLDELRQMDHLGRGQRRKLKALQIARERWRGANGAEPGLAQLAELCGMSIDEIARLEQADLEGRARSSSATADAEDPPVQQNQHFAKRNPRAKPKSALGDEALAKSAATPLAPAAPASNSSAAVVAKPRPSSTMPRRCPLTVQKISDMNYIRSDAVPHQSPGALQTTAC